MKRILTLLFSLAVLLSYAQQPVITAYASGHVTLNGTNIPVADHLVKVSLYSTDSLPGSYYQEDLYTNQEGYYAFQGSVYGTQGYIEIQTEVCDNQLQTEVYPVSYNSYNTFAQDFFVCDYSGCNADYYWYPVGNLTYQFQNLSTGDSLIYSWYFGDGTYSNDENPLKVYQAPGMYEVTLSISTPDPAGCSSTNTQYLWAGDTITGCQAFFRAMPDSAGGKSVAFFDMSQGNIDSWYWDFGDGTTSYEQNPVHYYGEPGAYTVCLTASAGINQCSDTYCEVVYIDIYPDCLAYFYAIPDSAGGLTASFYDMSSGQIDNWLWEFGDGSLSNDQNPVHEYSQPGIYNVCLTITNNSNQCWNMYCETVFIGQSMECVAQFAWYPNSPENPTEIQFLDLSYGNMTNWQWSFGDGTGSSEQNPLHSYSTTGNYDVCLTIYGPDCQSTWCETIYVDVMQNCANYFTYNQAGMDVVFYGSTLTNLPAQFYWEFGDGITANGNPVTHTYSAPGIYYVTLTTVDSEQCVATSFGEIVVGDTIWYNQIYGQVFEENWPLSNGMVMIFSDNSDTNFYTPYYEMTTVDPSGVFIFPMVPNGSYKIMAIPTDGSTYLPTYYQSTVFWQEATTIITGTTVNPVNIYLQNSQANTNTGTGTISGHISQSLKAGFLGQIVVYLTDANYNIIGFARVDDNGDFSFNDLANGTYYIKPELAGVYSEYQMVVLNDNNNQISIKLTFNGNSILGKDEGISMSANVALHPNPAKETVRLSFTQKNRGYVEISLYDLSGRALMNQSYDAATGSSTVDLKINMLEPGVYLFKLKFADGSAVTQKLIKN